MRDRVLDVLQAVWAISPSSSWGVRVAPDQGVAGGAGVNDEPGQHQFLGRRPAPGNVPGIEYQTPVTRLGEVAGWDQAVVARAGNDDVRGARVQARPTARSAHVPPRPGPRARPIFLAQVPSYCKPLHPTLRLRKMLRVREPPWWPRPGAARFR